jgi:ATP-binding cassette subfamily F protein 2
MDQIGGTVAAAQPLDSAASNSKEEVASGGADGSSKRQSLEGEGDGAPGGDGEAVARADIEGLPATTTTAAADVDAEEMGGEAMHRWLMNSAMNRINVTTSSYNDRIHVNARDVKAENLTVILNGKELLKESSLTLNWGRRYGLIGPNGCGKSILMTMLGLRMLPMPGNMDVYHVQGEVDPSDLTALQAVLAVDTERKRLEEAAASMEADITGEDTPEQEELNARLCEVYENLEEMGAETAEARASLILFGLGFDAAMQAKTCKEFSGGWRMRVALARALFLNPSLLLLDEPTNHLDMEAVVYLEKHLAKHNKILLMVSHSQDFMNGVCTNIIRFHKKKLEVYGGNYNTYIETRKEKEEAQMKLYDKQQGEIAHIKDFVNRFGHGTRKMAQQAQSREKVLRKMEDEGLTEKVRFCCAAPFSRRDRIPSACVYVRLGVTPSVFRV